MTIDLLAALAASIERAREQRRIDKEPGAKIACRWKGHEMKWCEGCGDSMCPCTEGHDLPDNLCDICAGR